MELKDKEEEERPSRMVQNWWKSDNGTEKRFRENRFEGKI